MKKTYTKTYKIRMVKKYKKSNVKTSDFCKANEIPISTFNRWLLENEIETKVSDRRYCICQVKNGPLYN